MDYGDSKNFIKNRDVHDGANYDNVSNIEETQEGHMSSIATLKAILFKSFPLLRVPNLKKKACMDILSSLATFLIEQELKSFSNTERNFTSKVTQNFRMNSVDNTIMTNTAESEWKNLVRTGYHMIIESLDVAYNMPDTEICQSCLQSLLQEILPALTTNEFRQIILDILPHFVPSYYTENHHTDMLINQSQLSLEETSKSILSCFQSILQSDSDSLIPIIGCLSTLPLSEYGKKEAYQVTLSSLSVVPEDELPIVVKTLFGSITSLKCAIDAIHALRDECWGLSLNLDSDLNEGNDSPDGIHKHSENHSVDYWLSKRHSNGQAGVLLFLGHVVAELLSQDDESMHHFDNGRINMESTELLRESIMQVFETIINPKLDKKTKQSTTNKNWTIVDLVVLLILFQIEGYRSRVESFLLSLTRHPKDFPYQTFHHLIHQMRLDSHQLSNQKDSSVIYEDSYKKQQQQFSNCHDDRYNHRTGFDDFKMSVDKTSANEGNLYGFLSETIVHSLFEMSFWLLLIPCNTSLVKSLDKNTENIIQVNVSRNSDVMVHLCITQPTIQEEAIECLLSMSGLSFLQMGQYIPEGRFASLFSGQISSLIGENNLRSNGIDYKTRVYNGIRQAALTASNIIMSIAKKNPSLILPYYPTILDRIKMEGMTDVNCRSFQGDSKRFRGDSCSILMICPQIVHRFCQILAFFMDTNRGDDLGEGKRGSIDPASLLILVNKFLIGQDHDLSASNIYSKQYSIDFRPISFSQRQVIGIILALHLIGSTSKPKLSDTDIHSLLITVAKLMLYQPKNNNFLQIEHQHKTSLHDHNNHPLVGIQGCHFFYSIAMSSFSSSDYNHTKLAKMVFRHIKNIVASLNLVKLTTHVSNAYLAATGSVLAYQKSCDWIKDLALQTYSISVEGKNEFENHKTFHQDVVFPRREMVLCVQDFLESGGWWASSWWYHSSRDLSVDSDIQYNLRHCQAVYIYRLLDTYLALGRRESSNWTLDGWLLAKFQLPKWPSTLGDFFRTYNKETREYREEIDSYDSRQKNPYPEAKKGDYIDANNDALAYPYELWLFDTNAFRKKNKKKLSILDQSTTESLLKIGWSCAMAISSCAAVLNNAYPCLNGDESHPSIPLATAHSKNVNDNHSQKYFTSFLIQYQLSRFYDLKIRADLCIQLLNNHIQSQKFKGLGTQTKKVKHAQNKHQINLAEKYRSQKKKSGIVRDYKKRKSIEITNNFDAINIGYLRALKLEIWFLKQCVRKQHRTLLSLDILWHVLTKLSSDTHLKDHIEAEISSQKNKKCELDNKSLLHRFNLHTFLLEHLSEAIQSHEPISISSDVRMYPDGEAASVYSSAEEDLMSFHDYNTNNYLTDARIEEKEEKNKSNKSSINRILDFYGLGYIMSMTGFIAPWLPVLRKKDFKSQVLSSTSCNLAAGLSFSKATRLLSSHYKIILSSLRFLSDEQSNMISVNNDRSNGLNQSKMSPSVTEFVDICARDLIKSNHLSKFILNYKQSKDDTAPTSISHQLKMIIDFFQIQVVEYCEDASLASQLLDILFLLTSWSNENQSFISLSWKVLQTIYTINPDMRNIDHDEREFWSSRISSPPLAYSWFAQNQMKANSNSSIIISSLKSLNKMATSNLQIYQQCSVLRHNLLTYWCLLHPRDYFPQLKKMFIYLYQVVEHASKRTIGNKIQHESYGTATIPGLTEFSYPFFFEMLLNVLVTSIALSSPPTEFKCSKDDTTSPYSVLQSLAHLFNEVVSDFIGKNQLFPKRSFKTLLESCITVTKIIEYKVGICVIWRSKQPILTDEDKRDGVVDKACITYLQILINNMVSCAASILNFCDSIRKEAQKQKKESKSFDDISKHNSEDEDVDKDDLEGEQWVFASYHKTITLLDLRCEKLIDSLRTTCRSHNLVPPNLCQKENLKHEKDPHFSAKAHSKNKQKTKISLLLTDSIDNSNIVDATGSNRIPNVLGNIEKMRKDFLSDIDEKKQELDVDHFDDDGSCLDCQLYDKDELSEADSLSSDSFGAIGDWGDSNDTS